ncbi:MAG: GTP 3',8-cyclase MoaA [Candidatus Lambdaproteobacteria bacterium]|nr:GTP 3',8-cyclase MoaA [Candidatus Lambdaproteobacteria bacterium]
MDHTTVDTLGRPLRDLRISVTDKCNFRCPYCMPIEIYGDGYQFAPKSTVLTFEEITRLAGLFVRAGVEKIRLTGGEPLLRKGLTELVRQLSGIAGLRDLTLTTNGWFLGEQAQALCTAGLRRITVSLDSLNAEVFGRMNGRGYGVTRVLEGIAAAQAVGLQPVKINAVVQKGINDHTLVELAAWAREAGVIARFIEYMDVGNRNGWRLDDVVPSAQVVAAIHAAYPLEPAEPNYRGEVAQRYRYVDGRGEIGMISSITQPFCGDCTRGRLSTDGEFVTCLFATRGSNLRDPLRAGETDEQLLARIDAVWGRRTDRYSELRTAETQLADRKFEMYRIGG